MFSRAIAFLLLVTTPYKSFHGCTATCPSAVVWKRQHTADTTLLGVILVLLMLEPSFLFSSAMPGSCTIRCQGECGQVDQLGQPVNGACSTWMHRLPLQYCSFCIKATISTFVATSARYCFKYAWCLAVWGSHLLHSHGVCGGTASGSGHLPCPVCQVTTEYLWRLCHSPCQRTP